MNNLKKIAALSTLAAFLSSAGAQTARAVLNEPPIFVEEEKRLINEEDQILGFEAAVAAHKQQVKGKLNNSIVNDKERAIPESFIVLLNRRIFDTNTLKKLTEQGYIPSSINLRDVKRYVEQLTNNLSFAELAKTLRLSIIASENDELVIRAYSAMRKASYEEFMDFMFSFKEYIIDGTEVDMNMASDMVRLVLTLDAINVVSERFTKTLDNKNLSSDKKYNEYVLANNTVDSLIVASRNVAMRRMAYEIFENDCESKEKTEMFRDALAKLGEQFSEKYNLDRIVIIIDSDEITNKNTDSNDCEYLSLDGYSIAIDAEEQKILSLGE